MKKFKGQSLTNFLLVGVLVGFVGITLWTQFGKTFSQTMNKQDLSQKFSSGQAVHYENPKDLVSKSGKIITVQGASSYTPLESVIRSNIADGEYIQTSGSSGRSSQVAGKESLQIMANYVNQIKSIASNLNGGNSTYKNQFITRLDYLNDSISQNLSAATSATDDLSVKLNLIYFNYSILKPGGTNLTQSQTIYNNYKNTLPDSTTKSLIDYYWTDLTTNIIPNFDFSINNNIYANEGGHIAQGNVTGLISHMLTECAKKAYTDDQIKLLSSEINITPKESYSTMFSKTFNNDKLCSILPSICVAKSSTTTTEDNAQTPGILYNLTPPPAPSGNLQNDVRRVEVK